MSIDPPSSLSSGPLSRDSLSPNPPGIVIAGVALGLMLLGRALDNAWIGTSSGFVALLLAVRILLPPLKNLWQSSELGRSREQLLATLVLALALVGLASFTGFDEGISAWFDGVRWEAFSALGQILIAALTLWVAWRQNVLTQTLTSQQNKITQQQTIDTYFQGISDLVLDEEGQLEDWPQERAIAEGRTSALLSSVDADGKAQILRFLSQAKLLTPLRRDRLLGRAILDGFGSYEEEPENGVRVIDLGVMLEGTDLAGKDLRWTDLSEARLSRCSLKGCRLSGAKLYCSDLSGANLQGADLYRTVLFVKELGADGKDPPAELEDWLAAVTPREGKQIPDYTTGAFTGAIVEDADFSEVRRLAEEQRYYLCAWGGSQTRGTIPGGCEGIPNRLGR